MQHQKVHHSRRQSVVPESARAASVTQPPMIHSHVTLISAVAPTTIADMVVAAVISGYGWGATVAEAWLDEKYGIYYGQSGDQTGLETRTRNIYIYPWNCILRYEGDDMEAHEVWDYNYESTAPKGNMYNCVVDIHKNAQPNKVWEYNYNGIAPGGNMFNCLVDTHRKVEALEKAIEKIEIGGAAVDYDKLAEAVADKLAKRMAD